MAKRLQRKVYVVKLDPSAASSAAWNAGAACSNAANRRTVLALDARPAWIDSAS
jgi:hypothetical protein